MVDRHEIERRQADLDVHAARRPRVARRHAGHGRGLRRLDQALGRARRHGPEADVLRGGACGAGRQDLPHDAEGAVRARAADAGKPGANVPFMMPKRVAETDPNKQITDYTGSGPFIFKRTNGARRQGRLPEEPEVQAARRAGLGPRRRQGRQGRSRRVDLDRRRADPGQRAASTARSTSSRRRRTTCCRCSPRTRTSSCSSAIRWAASTRFRFNVLHKPFDNPKMRQAVAYALNQKDLLDAVIGDPS